MVQKNIIDLWISRLAMGLIFCYCLGAFLYGPCFAQIHVTLRFLPFPIFIGEILLLICLGIFLIAVEGSQLFGRRLVLWLSLYFGWVFFKSFFNYIHDGPLTCRNAALFYYPVFAVFTYFFYQKAKLPVQCLMALGALATGILLFKIVISYCWWTSAVVVAIAIWNIRNIKWRWVAGGLLAIIFLLAKDYIYHSSRSHVISLFVSILFLVFYLGMLFSRRKNFSVLGFLLVGLVLFIVGFFVFSYKTDIESMTSLNKVFNTFNYFDHIYQSAQKNYVPSQLEVHLYNEKRFASGVPDLSTNPVMISPEISVKSAKPAKPANLELPCSLKSIGHRIIHGRRLEERSFSLDENNIIFRLFVWRDMGVEFLESRNPRVWLTGFSFGHPQRSRSIETLGWASSEWSRDGWITPHNSFFHIIYRAGILGIILIIILFCMLIKLTKNFFNLNSVEGGLLISILIYWLVLSNFLVILEFPYNAIIFWSIFGITWGYCHELKTRDLKQ